jgi:hypothetical protein
VSGQESKILEALTKEGIFLEEIFYKTDIPQGVVTKLILELQLKGLVKETRPSYFARVR